MTDFTPADIQPYSQSLWQKPTTPLRGLWQEPSHQYGSIPEPLYRLRLSVLHNNQGRDDCPTRIYLYPSLSTLTAATTEIDTSFGGAFPKCKIQHGGDRTTDEALMAGVDDARTRSVVLLFDAQSADESWAEFVSRLEKLEERWTEESESE
ncbi:hypothetical protein MMC21_004010 [Puttea exsequens]|nr:hypothetical protein [Puttea exsequens]